jgi:hypothetical protein
MRRFGRLVALCFLFVNTEAILMAQKSAPPRVTHLYTGGDGMSHFERVDVKFSPVPEQSGARAESEPISVQKSYFVRLSPGFFLDWHNAEARRYVITISGRAELVVTGGQKFVAQPGDLLLAEDLTGKGHTFRVLGGADWVAMFVDMGK